MEADGDQLAARPALESEGLRVLHVTGGCEGGRVAAGRRHARWVVVRGGAGHGPGEACRARPGRAPGMSAPPHGPRCPQGWRSAAGGVQESRGHRAVPQPTRLLGGSEGGWRPREGLCGELRCGFAFPGRWGSRWTAQSLFAVGSLLATYGWYIVVACVLLYALIQKLATRLRSLQQTRLDRAAAEVGQCQPRGTPSQSRPPQLHPVENTPIA